MMRKLKAQSISVPEYTFKYPKVAKVSKKLTLFDLSSHRRAREALDFGLAIDVPDFHIYVIGEDRTGRLNATLDYLEHYALKCSLAKDWVYLYNFDSPEEPLPFEFPRGQGKDFCKTMKAFIKHFATNLLKKFNTEEFTNKLTRPSKKIEENIQSRLKELRDYALKHDIDIARNPDGTITPVHLVGEKQKSKKKDKKFPSSEVWNEISEQLQAISLYAEYESELLYEKLEKIKKTEAAKILEPIITKHLGKFREIGCLQSWLDQLEKDILTNLEWFIHERGEEETIDEENILSRYTVNLFVQSPKKGCPVIVEPNPTYENLFGTIKYKNTANGYTTNFSMISPGSLHTANGGILIIRADALAMNPESWKYLKDALRDREIRIEELHRSNSIPMLEAPKPKPISLNLKIVIIGSPFWFYSYFYHDTDFQTYFKVKADINSHFPANSKNISTMAKLLQAHTTKSIGFGTSKQAMTYVLGYSARLSGHRKKLSARFEALLDILYEAGTLAQSRHHAHIKLDDVKDAITMRDMREALIEEETLEMVHEGIIHIATKGEKVGQVNGLTVQEVGGYEFGSPARITAQSSIGMKGMINIEHMVEMGGSIQHKGVLILEGFLRSYFAQDFPLSCNCSITFEQTYVGVEGDSASAAELCAVLSSLSKMPLRQDIAITGAINQFGDIQAVGGVSQKIEGFYKACKRKGLLNTQGVIIPRSNESSLVLSPEVSEAVEKDEFHIWSITHVTDALELLTKTSVKDIFKKAKKTLEGYDKSLKKRYGL